MVDFISYVKMNNYTKKTAKFFKNEGVPYMLVRNLKFFHDIIFLLIVSSLVDVIEN